MNICDSTQCITAHGALLDLTETILESETFSKLEIVRKLMDITRAVEVGRIFSPNGNWSNAEAHGTGFLVASKVLKHCREAGLRPGNKQVHAAFACRTAETACNSNKRDTCRVCKRFVQPAFE